MTANPTNRDRQSNPIVRRLYGLAATLALVAGVTLGAPGDAFAQCAPDGTPAAQNITCSGADGDGLNAGAGNDTITGDGTADITGTVTGGTDNDIIDFGGGDTISVNVEGGGGDDTVTLNGAEVGADVLGNPGNDIINILGSTTVGGDVNGQADNDTITISGTADITGSVIGAAGMDSVSISGAATIGGDVSMGTGADTVTMTGGTVTGSILAGAQDDVVTISGGTVSTNLEGGTGNDSLTVSGTGTVTNDMVGGAGTDTLTVTGGSVGGNVSGQIDNDTLLLSGGTISGNATGDSGDDTITVNGTATIVGDVDGGTENDNITVGGTAGVGNDVLGGDGNDTLLIEGSATVSRNVDGGIGNDSIAITANSNVTNNVIGDEGNDTIVINTTGTIGGNVRGSAGDDSILMQAGTVSEYIDGQGGADTITMTGGTVTGNLEGGGNQDRLEVSGGSAGAVLGEERDDVIIVNGTANIVGDVSGGEHNDDITIDGSATIGGDVNGDDGAGAPDGTDTITMNGGSVTGNVFGNGEADLLTLAGGTIGVNADAGGGDDTILLSGTAVTGNVTGNAGNDTIGLTGGSAANVLGGSGNDTIVADGTASISGEIDGESNDDLILMFGATLVNRVDGGSGNDTIEFFGAGAGGSFEGSVLTDMSDGIFGGSGIDEAIFTDVTGTLPIGFEGFETVALVDNTILDVHHPSNDVRDIGASADGPFTLFVELGSTLIADGNSPGVLTVPGNYANAGVLTMLDGEANDRVDISGDYAGGTGSSLVIDASLDAANSGDYVTIGGSVANVSVPSFGLVTHDSTAVTVNDIGTGFGIETGNGPGDGILVVDVSNTGNTDDDDFSLVGEPVQAGAVEYSLVLQSDDRWYLQSELLDQILGYAAAPTAANAMLSDYLGNLQERVGTREQSWTGGATKISDGWGLWLRGGGSFMQVEDDDRLDYQQDHWFGQVGLDIPLMADAESGHLILSVLGHAGRSEIDVDDEDNVLINEARLYAYGGGLSLTWYQSPDAIQGGGLYVDAVAVANTYDYDLKTPSKGQVGETSGWGWGASLEAGYGIPMGEMRLIPQAQIAYTAAYLDDFVDDDGVIVEFGDADSLEGRLGVAVDTGKLWRSGNAYFEANVVHEFLGESDVVTSMIDVGGDLGGTSAEVGFGGTVSLVDNVGFYADIDYRIPFDNGRTGVKAEAGIRLSW